MARQRRSLAVCASAGCDQLTASPEDDHCPAHRRQRARRGRAGIPAAVRGYDARWNRIRRWVLAEEPICRCGPECCPTGCGRPSEVVDHISPREVERLAGRDPERRENLQALAASCHGRKTVRHDGGFGRARRPA
jgi:5-methylcytosine-specific restriction protein A